MVLALFGEGWLGFNLLGVLHELCAPLVFKRSARQSILRAPRPPPGMFPVCGPLPASKYNRRTVTC